jgi:hypothetical protein
MREEEETLKRELADRFWRKILKRLILMDRVIFVHETV